MGFFLKKFLQLEAASGILLILAAVMAMLLANTSLIHYYQLFLGAQLQIRLSDFEVNKPLILWINDGLMAIFFFLIGLEVKRELLVGALSSREKATLPAIAAIGGMLVPSLIYTAFNYSDEISRNGWAIPAATDIAFALGVMALLGKRVPVSLKAFLLALAIIDDLGAIIIIAVFYTHQISFEAISYGVIAFLILCWMNYKGVDSIKFYIVVGIVLWVAVLKSGVHATLAGVVLGFMIPLQGKDNFSPLIYIEEKLHPWSAYFILPLFAFANAGIVLDSSSLSSLFSPIPLGIFFGLLIGKPIGVFLFSFIAVKAGISSLPVGISLKNIFAVSVLSGIGFTMSIFIATLAFESHGLNYINSSRIGILAGSTVAAVTAYIILRLTLPKIGADEQVGS